MSELRRALAPAGTLVFVGGSGGPWLMGMGRTIRALVVSPLGRQRLRPFFSKENRADLGVLKALIEAGTVTPVVDRTYPLTRHPGGHPGRRRGAHPREDRHRRVRTRLGTRMRRPRADEPPAAGGGSGGPVPAAATAGGAGNAEAEGTCGSSTRSAAGSSRCAWPPPARPGRSDLRPTAPSPDPAGGGLTPRAPVRVPQPHRRCPRGTAGRSGAHPGARPAPRPRPCGRGPAPRPPAPARPPGGGAAGRPGG